MRNNTVYKIISKLKMEDELPSAIDIHKTIEANLVILRDLHSKEIYIDNILFVYAKITFDIIVIYNK